MGEKPPEGASGDTCAEGGGRAGVPEPPEVFDLGRRKRAEFGEVHVGGEGFDPRRRRGGVVGGAGRGDDWGVGAGRGADGGGGEKVGGNGRERGVVFERVDFGCVFFTEIGVGCDAFGLHLLLQLRLVFVQHLGVRIRGGCPEEAVALRRREDLCR